MSSVQTLATWAQIAAKIDTFPKLPAGSVDIFLTKSEILAKGGGLVKIEDGYSDNSFVALEHVSQYVVEWRYTFDVLRHLCHFRIKGLAKESQFQATNASSSTTLTRMSK